MGLTACMEETVEKRVLVEAVKHRADDSLWGRTRYKYDKYGRKIEELEKEDGKVIRKLTWEYDKQGNVLKEYVLDLRMGRIEMTHLRDFDDKGREIEYKLIDKSKYTPDYSHYKYKYDEQDKVIEEVVLNKSGDIVWQRVYGYDQDGRMILKKSIDQDGKEFLVEKWEYNGAGKEIYYQKIEEGEEKRKIIREFDEAGNEVAEISYEDGKLIYDATYSYDENGNQIRGKSIDDNGEIKAYWKTDYNENNEKLLDEEYNKEGKLIKVQKWKYDKKGNRLRYWGLENGKLDFDWIYKYDDNGNLIYHEQRDGKGGVENWEAYEWYENGQKKMSNTAIIPFGRSVQYFDQKGKLIESKDLSEDGSILKHWEKYYYNENGELIKLVGGDGKVTNGYYEYKYANIKVYK